MINKSYAYDDCIYQLYDTLTIGSLYMTSYLAYNLKNQNFCVRL